MKKTTNVPVESVESKVMWGVFDLMDYNEVHVVPTIDQVIMRPHKLNKDCPCHPAIEDGVVIIHNMLH